MIRASEALRDDMAQRLGYVRWDSSWPMTPYYVLRYDRKRPMLPATFIQADPVHDSLTIALPSCRVMVTPGEDGQWFADGEGEPTPLDVNVLRLIDHAYGGKLVAGLRRRQHNALARRIEATPC